MSERQKVRLVRCPKCENLLREHFDLSVYRCGSCGTFLQAKKELAINEGPLKKLDEENEESFEILKSPSQRENAGYLHTKSPYEKQINGYFLNNRKDAAFKHKNHNLLEYNDNMYRLSMKQQVGSFVGLNEDQYNQMNIIEESAECLIGSKGIMDFNRMANNRTKSSGFTYPSDGANAKRFADLEQDRVELIRKLDELKEQISRNASVKHAERRAEFEQHGNEMEMLKSYSHGEYIGFNRAQFASYSRSSTWHHMPACSCINCHNTNPMTNRSAKSGSRWPSDHIDSNVGMFHMRNTTSGFQSARFCHPMAGGSPYIACSSCFQVLKLPRQLMLREKNRHKLQCGACSMVLSLETRNKKRSISISVEKAKCNGTIATSSKEVPLSNAGNIVSKDQRQNLRKFESVQESATPFYVSPKYENNDGQDSMVVQSDFSHISKPSSKYNDSSSYLEENRNKEGNENACQNNLSSECEVEVSLNDRLTSDLSRESMEASKSKEEEIGTNKDSKSFVSINGQPIPDHVVKKVEKLAGTIQPGDYWYDFEAGFWGVMGHPCLGIIPPFIKEFNYPMARNCGGGNTRVFVNGRELNHKDLDLLASRGLPTTKDKFYVIEISGRVFDNDSGIKICSLGRLAPTVEKLRRGFGMKVPRSCEK